MAQELDLNQLSNAMRRQQEGQSNGKKIVWDKNKMTFVELSGNEQVTDEQSPVNDVSKRPFFNI